MGWIVAIVFVIILVSVILMEVYAPNVSAIVTIGLKAAAAATVISIIVTGFILVYKMKKGNLFDSEQLTNVLAEVVKTGIKKTSDDSIQGVKNTVINTMQSVEETTDLLANSLKNISQSLKKNIYDIQTNKVVKCQSN